MKQFYKYLVLAFFCFTHYLFLKAQQREVIIEPMGIAAIQLAVEADLAATDTVTVEQTKYILRRDAIYPYEVQWEPPHGVWLEAEEGDGARPVMLAVHPASGEAPRFIRVATNYTLIGIDFAGFDSAGEHTDNAPLRPRGDGTRLWVEDCIVDNQRFEICRTDGTNQKVYLINNIFRNNYQRDLWSKNGGAWFQRGNPVDTFVFSHNTYFNTTGRMFHDLNDAPIQYFEVSHNTVVNVGGLREFGNYGGNQNIASVDLGTALNLVCENNIFYNVQFFGILPEWDTLHYAFAFDFTDSTESVVFRNNNIYTDPDLLAGTPDTAAAAIRFSPELDSLLGDDLEALGIISEPLEFVNAPMSKDIFIQAKTDRWADPGNAVNQRLDLDDATDNYMIDFAYGTAAASYTAGTNGQPLGSGRWNDVMVNTDLVRDYDGFNLVGNFPNPVQDLTTIEFSLNQPATVQISIYDLNGKRVWQVDNLSFGIGSRHQVNVDASDFVSGMYTYELVANLNGLRAQRTGRMIIQ